MSLQCGFSGNSDLYGLGIRLGVYLQWATAGVAYAMDLRHEASSVFEAYIIFTIAIMIALFSVTFTLQMHVIEIAIMLYLYFGGLMSVVYYIANQNPTDRKIWRQITVIISWVVTCGYSAWFWLHGRETDRFVQDACGTTLFLFAKLGPNHLLPLSRFFASISIIFGVLFGLYMVPLPPNFTVAQSEVYLDLERDAVLKDMEEYVYDFDLLTGYITAVRCIIEKQYEKRKLCFSDKVETGSDKEKKPSDVIANQNHCPTQSISAMAKFTSCLSATATFMIAIITKIDEHLPGPGTLRAICQRFYEYLDEREKNRTKRDEAKRNAREHLPALSLLELNELRVRDPKYKEWKIPFTIIHAIISIYTVIAVELMLHWNNVEDVYTIRSVGQLIPFVIGLVGFVKLFLELKYRKKVAKNQEERESEDAAPVATPDASMQALNGK